MVKLDRGTDGAGGSSTDEEQQSDNETQQTSDSPVDDSGPTAVDSGGSDSGGGSSSDTTDTTTRDTDSTEQTTDSMTDGPTDDTGPTATPTEDTESGTSTDEQTESQTTSESESTDTSDQRVEPSDVGGSSGGGDTTQPDGSQTTSSDDGGSSSNSGGSTSSPDLRDSSGENRGTPEQTTASETPESGTTEEIETQESTTGEQIGGQTRDTEIISSQQRSAAIGSFIAQNPDLVDTGAADPDGGIFDSDEIVVRGVEDGEIIVGPTEEAIQREQTQRANQSVSLGTTGTPELATGAVETTQRINAAEPEMIRNAAEATAEDQARERELEAIEEREGRLDELQGAAERYVNDAQQEQEIDEINNGTDSESEIDDINFTALQAGGVSGGDVTEAVAAAGLGLNIDVSAEGGDDPVERGIKLVGRDAADLGRSFAEDNPVIDNPDSTVDRGVNIAQQSFAALPGETIAGTTETVELAAFVAERAPEAFEPSPVAPGEFDGEPSEDTQQARNELDTRISRITSAAAEFGEQVQEDPAQAGRAAPAVAGALLGGTSLARQAASADAPVGSAARGATRQIGDGVRDAPGDITATVQRTADTLRDEFTSPGRDRGQAGPGSLLGDSDTRTISGSDIASRNEVGSPRVGTDRTFEEGPSDTSPVDRPSRGQTRRDRQQLREATGEGAAPPRAAAARARAERRLGQDTEPLDAATQSDFFADSLGRGASGAAVGVAAGSAGVGADVDTVQQLGDGLGIETMRASQARTPSVADLGLGVGTQIETGGVTGARTRVETDALADTQLNSRTGVGLTSETTSGVNNTPRTGDPGPFKDPTPNNPRDGPSLDIDISGEELGGGQARGNEDEQRFDYGERELL
ncbi:hypothetical protein Hbl1158_16970 (plasmid) [Halobaculum sp. CBA1158]|uniref:hypothetical protein n=1 Tax=Halobaculum sp. CBA1158 TaxID=2904243 RepID=UPI001F1B134F|nr:hypothetical protein [Halobaculum sp. CBA1158]UIP01747.1 hypothetical protein Hbl1158_16970 [Halobaculum sp. CBA1158]